VSRYGIIKIKLILRIFTAIARDPPSPHRCRNYGYGYNRTLAGLAFRRVGIQQTLVLTCSFYGHLPITSSQPGKRSFSEPHSTSITKSFSELKKWKLSAAKIVKGPCASPIFTRSWRTDILQGECCGTDGQPRWTIDTS
jgi:hypothetical protein